MSSSGSASGITFGGISSGIDTEGIITKLLQVEAIPLQRLQTQQRTLAQRQQVYQQLSTQLSSVAQAAGALNSSATFSPIAAVSSTPATATVVGTSDAQAGTYNLAVTKLAQAQKIASTARTDTTSAIGVAGQATINGKFVQIDAGDSLRTIAQKINGLQAGVTASLIDGGSGSAYLTLTAGSTGAAKQIQLGDLSGGALASLGLIGGSTAVRESITNGATSYAFSASTTSIQSLFDTTGMTDATVNINGTDVTFSPSTDSLQGIANKINSEGITGVQAAVRAVTKDGTTTYKLDITGTSTPTITDPGHLFEALGILQKAPANQLVGAQDASFTLDGVPITSSSNTSTGAIPGATITLLKANATTPETTTVTLSRDNAAVKQKIQAFADAYNSMTDFIATNSKFDDKSFQSGVLFGDAVARQVQSSTISLLFDNVSGASGAYTNLAAIGFSQDKTGKLVINDTVLSKALTDNPEDVGTLFRSAGQGSTSSLAYVSSTTKSVPTSSTGYSVDVTAIATKQSFVAGTAQTSANPLSERLTFSGNLFAAGNYTLDLDIGSTLSTTVAKINADGKLKDLVFASIDGGKLRLDGKRYGTVNNFTVVSNFTSATNNSGIGVGGEGDSVAGVDTAGTINGETAIGNGQFLTGSSGNTKTDGLQVQYTGSTTGSVGTMLFSKGIGGLVSNLLGTFTDTVDGLLTVNNKTLQSSIDSIQKDMDDLNTRLTTRQTELRQKFAAMEEAIAKSQSQAQSLASLASSSK